MVFRFGCSNAVTVGQRACARQTALASELAYIYAAKTKDRAAADSGEEKARIFEILRETHPEARARWGNKE